MTNISFIGYGNVAKNLGNLIASAGYNVFYGVKDPAENTLSVEDAIKKSDIVFLAIPFDQVEGFAERNKSILNGKLLVDVTNPVNKDWSPVFLGEISAVEKLSSMLSDTRVVKAFNTIFADTMFKEKQVIDGHKITAFIASDNAEDAKFISDLTSKIGFNSFIVGALKNARYLEAMAHLNIAVALSGGGTNAGFAFLK